MTSSLVATRQTSQASGLQQALETGGDSVTQLWFQHPPVAADVETAGHTKAIVLSVVEQGQAHLRDAPYLKQAHSLKDVPILPEQCQLSRKGAYLRNSKVVKIFQEGTGKLAFWEKSVQDSFWKHSELPVLVHSVTRFATENQTQTSWR